MHAFLLVFGSLFLYFWFRKQESYATEAGDIHTRWADIMILFKPILQKCCK